MFDEYLKKLQVYGRLYFTVEDAVKELGMPKENIYNVISRLKKKGELISPAKGLYVIVPDEHSMEGCIPAEALVPILMKHLKIPYYAGLLTAAMYHGATHQKPSIFQVVTTKRFKKDLHIGKIRIAFLYKQSLKDLPTQTVTVDTGYLVISTPEVTAMDLFLYPDKSGGINHIATVLSELVEVLNPKKLIALAKSSKSQVWIQRLGYVLDSIDSFVPKHQKKVIYALSNYITTNSFSYKALTAKLPTTNCKRSEKWKIIENITVESDL